MKVISIEEHFFLPLSERPGQLRPAPVKTQVNRSTLPICLECLRGGGRLGTTAALNQHCSAIYHNGLPGAESFLHQKQIGLRYVMSLADSANRETLSHTFVQTFALRCAHALPEVCPNDSGRYRVNPYWCQLDR